MTILDVFIHDPLYNWTLTAEKANAVQRRGEANSPLAFGAANVEVEIR